MTKFILPLGEFNRIHQLIHGAIRAEGDPGRACTLFACIGALILNGLWGLGVAVYMRLFRA